MDGQQFDDLVRRFCTTRLTRLNALRGLVAGAAAVLTGATLAADDTDAKKKRGNAQRGKNNKGGKGRNNKKGGKGRNNKKGAAKQAGQGGGGGEERNLRIAAASGEVCACSSDLSPQGCDANGQNCGSCPQFTCHLCGGQSDGTLQVGCNGSTAFCFCQSGNPTDPCACKGADGTCFKKGDAVPTCPPVPCPDEECTPNACQESCVCVAATGLCSCTAKDCSAEDDTCNVGVCVNGQCQKRIRENPETISCDDGLFCTENTVCVADPNNPGQGTCGGGTAKVCPGNECNTGRCDEANDRCTTDPKSGICGPNGENVCCVPPGSTQGICVDDNCGTCGFDPTTCRCKRKACTHGFWKNQPCRYPAGITGNTTLGELGLTGAAAGIKLSDALQETAGALVFQTAAALLNLRAIGECFGLTLAQIQALYDAGNIDALAAANEAGKCPFNACKTGR